MSVAQRDVLRHLVASARVATVLVVLAALAVAAACEEGPEPAPSPTAATTATPGPTTPTATTGPTVVATPPVTSTPQTTPTASPTATATPTPSPTPAPTPAPEPRDALDLIESAPDAFEHRTFESGETIDWDHGIFVLDPVTGLTDGYRVRGAEALHYNEHFPGGWIRSWDPSEKWALLLHRASGQSWRWPDAELRLVSAWPGHLLFEELRDRGRHATGHLTLADTEMKGVARFSIHPKVSERSALVSPDGQTLAIGAGTRVYLVTVGSSRVTVVFETDPEDATARAGIYPWWDGPGIRVRSSRNTGKNTWDYSDHFFNWEGKPAASPDCPSGGAPGLGWIDGSAWTSPDGRYVAWLQGEPAFVKYVGFPRLNDPWPSLVIADAAMCVPIFRVRSARTGERAWSAEWLATSEGLVVGTHDGYVIVRVQPTPEIIPLLSGGRTGEWDTGPEPAPTGDGRYFGYAWHVYDAMEDRWVGPALPPEYGQYWRGYAPGPYWWGDSYRERWFAPSDYWGEGWLEWLLLPPRIEFPPFSGEIAFRVAGTGDCLHLRSEPDTDSEILDCLRDGMRIVFVQREHPGEAPLYSLDLSGVHPSLAGPVESAWVYVRTAADIEGWVSHDYLEHD